MNMKKIKNNSRKNKCALYCSFLFFKVLGLAPFSVNIPQLFQIQRENDSHNEKAFTTSSIGIIYNLALIVCIICIDSHTTDNVKRNSPSVKLPRIIGKCLTLTAFLLGISIWMIYILRNKRIVAMANHLLKLDAIMEKCNFLHSKFVNSVIFTSLTHLTSCCYLIAAEVSTQHTSILSLIVFVLPTLIISWTIVQYSLILHVIEGRIANVNKSLLEIGHIPEELEMPSLFVRKIPVADDALFKIICIREVNIELFNLCYKIRDFYALPTLMTVIFFGGSLVYSGYFLTMPLITRSDEHFHLTYINGIAWLSVQLSCLINLTISVTNITQTARKTANVIHILLDSCKLHSDILRELKGFSRQILMKKFQLSIYDMFSLDNSLLSSIAGVMLTYLVILIQFSTE